MKTLIVMLMVMGSAAFACEDQVAATDSVKVATLASVAKADARTCFDDLSCPPPAKCIGGKCVVGGTCLGDVDCPVGKKCVKGSCK